MKKHYNELFFWKSFVFLKKTNLLSNRNINKHLVIVDPQIAKNNEQMINQTLRIVLNSRWEKDTIDKELIRQNSGVQNCFIAAEQKHKWMTE